MPIASSASRYARLSRFVLEHASFRPSVALPGEYLDFWQRSIHLEGLVGDAAGILAGAMVVLGYLHVEPGDVPQDDRVVIGLRHRLTSVASGRLSVRQDDGMQQLRRIDARGAQNILHILPRDRTSVAQVADLIRSHVRLCDDESAQLSPGLKAALTSMDLDLRFELPRNGPPDGTWSTGLVSLLTGRFGREPVNVISRDWMKLVHAGLLNPSLLPNGLVLVGDRLHAPLGWSSLIQLPAELQRLVLELISRTAARRGDLDQTVTRALEYIGATESDGISMAQRLAGFATEASHLDEVTPVVATTSPTGRPVPEKGEVLVATLALAQLCYVMAARRAVARRSVRIAEPAASSVRSDGKDAV